MLKTILTWYHKGEEAVAAEVPFEQILTMPVVEKIGRLKRVPEDQWDAHYAAVTGELESQFAALMEEEADHA